MSAAPAVERLRGAWGAGGSTVAVLAILAAAAAWLGARSEAAFWIASAGLLLLVAYAAFRWPRAVIVGAALTTLLDPVVAARVIPGSLAGGPIGISEPILAVTGLAALASAFRQGWRPRFRGGDPTYALLALFVAVCVLSAVVNRVPPHVAGLGILMTIDALAVFFVWRALRPSEDAAWRAIIAVVVAALVVAVIGIGQIVLDADLLGFARSQNRSDIVRITSFLGNPNIAGLVLAFCVPLPLFAAVRPLSRRTRWIWGAASFVLVLALVLTFSRGALAAVGIGMVVGGLLIDWRALALFVLLAAASFALLPILPQSEPLAVTPSATPIPSPAEPGATSEPTPRPTPRPAIRLGGKHRLNSEESRLYFLNNGLEVIREHPVLGVGPGRYGGAAARIFPSPVHDEYATEFGVLRTVHNFWLHLTAEVGVAGVSVFLAMVVALLVRFVRAARRAAGSRFVVLAGAATSLVVIGVNNATEMLFEGNIPAVLIWLILAIGSVLAPDPGLGLLPRGRRAAG